MEFDGKIYLRPKLRRVADWKMEGRGGGGRQRSKDRGGEGNCRLAGEGRERVEKNRRLRRKDRRSNKAGERVEGRGGEGVDGRLKGSEKYERRVGEENKKFVTPNWERRDFEAKKIRN